MWLFTSTNESRLFTGGTMHDISATDPAWTHELQRQPDGRYAVLIGLDKVSSSTVPVDAYSFVGVTDSFEINDTGRKPTLQSGLTVEFAFEILENVRRGSPDPAIGEAKTRFVVGIVARSDNGNVTWYLEVNLARSNNFDLCLARRNLGGDGIPGHCDQMGIYDRRARWVVGHTSGEVVSINGEALDNALGIDLRPLPVEGERRHVRLPVTRLFESVPWVVEPPSHSEIAGIFIGTEIWGRGRTAMKVEDYEVFRD